VRWMLKGTIRGDTEENHENSQNIWSLTSESIRLPPYQQPESSFCYYSFQLFTTLSVRSATVAKWVLFWGSRWRRGINRFSCSHITPASLSNVTQMMIESRIITCTRHATHMGKWEATSIQNVGRKTKVQMRW